MLSVKDFRDKNRQEKQYIPFLKSLLHLWPN